jgi:hypothetical protein
MAGVSLLTAVGFVVYGALLISGVRYFSRMAKSTKGNAASAKSVQRM